MAEQQTNGGRYFAPPLVIVKPLKNISGTNDNHRTYDFSPYLPSQVSQAVNKWTPAETDHQIATPLWTSLIEEPEKACSELSTYL